MTTPADAQDKAPDNKAPWYRHRGLLVVLVIAVVLAVTVLTDLPVKTSRANDINAERSVMSELNNDLAPCALAVHQAIGIWNLQAAHSLSAADRANTPGLLSDDQTACSFTNENIFDLSNIEVPGSPAGKDMGQLVATVTTWATSDALHAIEDVQTLMSDSTNSAELKSLSSEESLLASDRLAAIGEENAADRNLDTRLPAPDLPSLARSTD